MTGRPDEPEADVSVLVEEQAALRRVAVTVATESAAERVFDVVAEEVAPLLGADAANLVSFGPESLANVAKYASASHARVDLAHDDGVRASSARAGASRPGAA